jgi:hypothetical protein
MTPEWKSAGPDQVPTEMGPAHPIQRILDQIKAQSPTIQNLLNSGVLQNDMDPRWSMAVAFDTIDDWAKKVYDETGKPPTAKEANDAFNRLKMAAFKAQGENLDKYKKMFPGAEMKDFWKAFKTGNWALVEKDGQNMLSQEKIGKVVDESRKRWDDMRDKENSAPLDDDGNPFQDQESYVQYKVDQYQTLISNMIKASQAQGQYRSTGGPQTPQGSTVGPQNKSVGIAETPGGQLGTMAGNAVAGRKYQAPAAEGPAPTQTVTAQQPQTLPPEAAAKLKKGQVTTFGNGQQWTIDQNGQPQRVK